MMRVRYLLTVWTAEPADEHRVLGDVLRLLAVSGEVPAALPRRRARRAGQPGRAGPRRRRRPRAGDMWGPLGVAPRASLELVVTLPARRPIETAGRRAADRGCTTLGGRRSGDRRHDACRGPTAALVEDAAGRTAWRRWRVKRTGYGHMRVDLLTPVVSLRAEQRGAFTLQVRNDSDVIEQIVCTVPGLDPAWYEVSPVALNLFPGDVGEVRLTLALPRTFPAGRHELHASDRRPGARPDAAAAGWSSTSSRCSTCSWSPTRRSITARRRGRYLVTLQNRGNAPVGDGRARVRHARPRSTLELDRPVLDGAAGRAADHRPVRPRQAAVVRRAGRAHHRRHRRAAPGGARRDG